MPKLLHVEEVRLSRSEVDNRTIHPRDGSNARTPGPDLSKVLRHIAVTTGILTLPTVPDGVDEGELPLRMALGMGWEEWAAGLYPDMVWQPGEMGMDGVYGTPDGLGVYEDEPVVEEFKLTWKSERADIFSEWLWTRQVMGYCKMLGYALARCMRAG